MGKDITDRIAREENEADKAAFSRYTTEPVKKGFGALKDAVMGTPEQNKAAATRMRARDEANPDSPLTKMNKKLGYGGYKKGGRVRGCGCAERGLTKGKMR